jgi:putative membrane protein
MSASHPAYARQARDGSSGLLEAKRHQCVLRFTKLEKRMRLLLTWLINALALLAVPYLMHSVSVDSFGAALIAALILGFVNTLIRPILLVLTLPATVLTLGLFIFIINGLMFWIVAQLVGGFHVASFWAAVGGAIVYSIVSWALSTLLLKKN